MITVTMRLKATGTAHANGGQVSQSKGKDGLAHVPFLLIGGETQQTRAVHFVFLPGETDFLFVCCKHITKQGLVGAVVFRTLLVGSK